MRRRPAPRWTPPSTCRGCCSPPRRRSTSSRTSCASPLLPVPVASWPAGPSGAMAWVVTTRPPGPREWRQRAPGSTSSPDSCASTARGGARRRPWPRLSTCCRPTGTRSIDDDGLGGRGPRRAPASRPWAGRWLRDAAPCCLTSTRSPTLCSTRWAPSLAPDGHWNDPERATTMSARPLRGPARRRRRPGRRRDRAGSAVHGRAPRRPRVVARCSRRWLLAEPRVVWLDGSAALYEERRGSSGRAARLASRSRAGPSRSPHQRVDAAAPTDGPARDSARLRPPLRRVGDRAARPGRASLPRRRKRRAPAR